MLMFCMLFSVAAFAAENKDFKTGDTNLDGAVNIKDATLIQKHIAEIAVIDANAMELADVDASGSVNVKDATLIQKYVAGIVTEFPLKKDEVEENTDVTTEAPSDAPTAEPTEQPTEIPTETPTEEPPTDPSTESPTEPPTDAPTKPSVDSDGYFNEVIRP